MLLYPFKRATALKFNGVPSEFPRIADNAATEGLVGLFVWWRGHLVEAVSGQVLEKVNSSGSLTPDLDWSGRGGTQHEGTGQLMDTFSGGATADRWTLRDVPSNSPLSLYGASEASFLVSMRTITYPNSVFPRLMDKSDGGSGANGWTLLLSDFKSGGGRSLNLAVNGVLGAFDFGLGLVSNSARIVGARSGDLTTWEGYEAGASLGTDTSYTAVFPSTTTDMSVGNWNHSTDRMFAGMIRMSAVWERDIGDNMMKRLSVPSNRRLFFQSQIPRIYSLPSIAAAGTPIYRAYNRQASTLLRM